MTPTKVTRTALGVYSPDNNAALLPEAGSIAALMLTTEAMVAEIPEEKKDMAHPRTSGMETCTVYSEVNHDAFRSTFLTGFVI